MIPVVWYARPGDEPRGYWDQETLERIFDGTLWRPAGSEGYEHFYSFDGLTGAVVVVHAAHCYELIEDLNARLAQLAWCVVLVTGNEERVFPTDQLAHPNMKLWVQMPHGNEPEGFRPFGTGCTPAVYEACRAQKTAPDKTYGWMFAGQINNARRIEMVQELLGREDGFLCATNRFAAGLPYDEYARELLHAKVVPCPSGPLSIDTFRLWEALEVGAVPIADTKSSVDDEPEFWTQIFGEEPPFHTVDDWMWFESDVNATVDTQPFANRVQAWYLQQRRKTAQVLWGDTGWGGNEFAPSEVITALITTSPILAHPETKLIEETVQSIRDQLGDCEIVIAFDGVRDEQEALRDDYEEYQRRVLWLCAHVWHNVVPYRSDEFAHQATLTRAALRLVATSLVLFVEHDTPLREDPIDWQAIASFLRSWHSEGADVVRLYHEASVHPEHAHLMIGDVEQRHGAPFLRTVQWSQRPHVARKSWYEDLLRTRFSDCSTMIEDVMHGIVQDEGWEAWKLWLYAPEGTMARTLHTDGRAGEPKYEMRFPK